MGLSFAALLDGVPHHSGYDIMRQQDGHPGQPTPDGKWVSYDEVLAALAAAVPADLAEVIWKPIETAPRGGEWFMARSEHGQTRAVHYADEYDRFPISHDGVVWSTAPVEWMPLSVFPALLARIAAQEAQINGLMNGTGAASQMALDYMARAEAAETALAAMTKERDELRAAIFGNPDYDPALRNGNFREMTETLHAANAGGRAALAAERAKTAKLVEAANQARMAFAGYVSAESAVRKLDDALAAITEAGQ